MRRDESQLSDAISDAVELDRRTVNRAMAWSVPVVMAAVAAPGQTGSPQPTPPTVTFGSASGLLDSSTGTIDFVLAAQSTAAGQIQFLEMNNGAATGLPTTLALAAGSNTLKLSVTKAGITTGNVTLTYSVDGGKTNAQVTVPVTYPAVTFSNPTGVLDPAGPKISFTLPANSTGRGPVTFTKLNGTAISPSVEKQLVTGDNSVTFDVTRPGLTVGRYTLSYKIGDGAEQTMPVDVASVTTYDSTASGATRAKDVVTFTLVFKGSSASIVAVKSVVPDAGSLTGTLPTAGERLDADLAVTFTMTRNQTHAKPTSATVTFSIDGQKDNTATITVP